MSDKTNFTEAIDYLINMEEDTRILYFEAIYIEIAPWWKRWYLRRKFVKSLAEVYGVWNSPMYLKERSLLVNSAYSLEANLLESDFSFIDGITYRDFNKYNEYLPEKRMRETFSLINKYYLKQKKELKKS